jgi:hypothetical protein
MNKPPLLIIDLRTMASVFINSISVQVLGMRGIFLPLVSLEVYNSQKSGSLVDVTLQVDELMRLAPDLFLQQSKPDLSSTSSPSQPAPVAPKRLKVIELQFIVRVHLLLVWIKVLIFHLMYNVLNSLFYIFRTKL